MSALSFIRGFVFTAAQWQSLFDGKQDVLGNPAANNLLVGDGSRWSPQTYQNVTRLLGVGRLVVPVFVNFNVGSADTPVPIVLPSGFTRYRVSGVYVSGASHDLTTATCGLFTAAAAGGTAIVTAATAITVSATTEATNDNMQSLTVNNQNTQSFNLATLYFRVATPEGVAATGTVTVEIEPLS